MCGFGDWSVLVETALRSHIAKQQKFNSLLVVLIIRKRLNFSR